MRITKATPALTAAAVLLTALLAGCADQPGSAAPPTATHSAAPAATTAPPDNAEWLAGHGGKLLDQVSADLGKVGDAAGTGDTAATEQAGTELAHDAAAAVAEPPPVQGAEYVNAMGHFTAAGTDLAAGDIEGATSEASTGSSLLTAMSDVLNGDRP